MNSSNTGGRDERAARDAALLGIGLASASGLGGGSAAWRAPDVEELAEAIPGVRVVALGGRGGMGAVYRAEQTRLGRTVAVKVLPAVAMPDPLARERFEREARILSALNHAHVLHVHDFGALADGTLYLVTEWAEGGDLTRLLGGRAQPLEVVSAWVGQIAEALDAAHARGVVHRDLKPANVLVRADGRLALADFGLAQAQGAELATGLTLSGTIFGTYDYMAPEQLSAGGAVSAAADVYALGVMTYQMLTGTLPRGAYAKPSQVVSTPVAVDALLDAAMSAEVAKRPKSAGEFARRLATAARRRDAGRAGRGRWLVVGAVTATVAMVAAIGVTLRSGRHEQAAPERGVDTERVTDAPRASEAPAAPPVAGAEKAVEVRVLAAVRPGADAVNGVWTLRGDALVSGEGLCVLRLPVGVPADFRYDVEVEFTRTTGVNSVAVFLPTAVGVGVFELDAWEVGLGGLQVIDGRDLRSNGRSFPARLRNGERQRLRLEVRGARVSAEWNGARRGMWDLTGRTLEPLGLWEAGAGMRLGLGTWSSPTVFHTVTFQAVPE